MNESITVQAPEEIALQLANARDLEHRSALFGQPLVLLEAAQESLPRNSPHSRYCARVSVNCRVR